MATLFVSAANRVSQFCLGWVVASIVDRAAPPADNKVEEVVRLIGVTSISILLGTALVVGTEMLVDKAMKSN